MDLSISPALQKYIESDPKIKNSQATERFLNYQILMKSHIDKIMDTMMDVTNYELWVSSGIGCSVCNPYYHDKFNSMGAEGLYFDEKTYCKNFFKNSGNYVNFFRSLRLIQHNVNYLLKFIKRSFQVSDLATLEDELKFKEAVKKMILKDGSKMKEWENAQNLWKYGVKFGVEYSNVKKSSINTKIENCVEEITRNVYPEECTIFCMQTNKVNLLTIGSSRFVINLLFTEFIIDRYWDLTNPGYYNDSVVKYYLNDLKNSSLKNVDLDDPVDKKKKGQDSDKNEEDVINLGETTKSAQKKMKQMSLQLVMKSPLGMFYMKKRELEILSVFKPYKSTYKPEDYNYFINFEKLNSVATSYKAGWVPFPNSMVYENVRITYDDGQPVFKVFALALMCVLLGFLKY